MIYEKGYWDALDDVLEYIKNLDPEMFDLPIQEVIARYVANNMKPRGTRMERIR